MNEKIGSEIIAESQIEQKEEVEKGETKIIFQRHSEYKKDPKEEVYWRLGISGKKKEALVNFLVEKNIIEETEQEKIKNSKFVEDDLIRIIDNGKLLDSSEEKEFLDFIMEIEIFKNKDGKVIKDLREAKEVFRAYIDNNRNFNEVKNNTNSGNLTENGRELTRKETIERLEEITKEDRPTDIVFLYSPTEWMDWRDEQGFAKGFGSRGKETAKEILNTISSEIKNDTELGEKIKENIRITGIGPNEKLRELDIFYIFDAPDPGAYIKALKEKYGREEWWEEYYNIAEDLEGLRKTTKAEGPKDLAKRFELIIKMTKLYNDKIKKEDSERELVIWMVSHMELIRSFVQYKLEAKEDAIDYHPDFNESLDISISSEGKITTRFKGKEYEIDLDEIK
ncbi:MAG: hypothetical protein KAI57_00180 [Candidatus Pacebacteria bacterium]|nr:hypothetical protein [Candidatus Paceibacterota bacterium]